ncbi:unnamed protein product [Notodromas monacha]|uniref:Uncharacterized protein n=1 Tax=Notodromas monacha TaxID=399045 RepID=A0A7R9BT94_9CRUS|nr:unnamed protein product [Notodromas monacha]CAG0921336.1 unnamed protein product [Notodromas monacha]
MPSSSFGEKKASKPGGVEDSPSFTREDPKARWSLLKSRVSCDSGITAECPQLGFKELLKPLNPDYNARTVDVSSNGPSRMARVEEEIGQMESEVAAALPPHVGANDSPKILVAVAALVYAGRGVDDVVVLFITGHHRHRLIFLAVGRRREEDGEEHGQEDESVEHAEHNDECRESEEDAEHVGLDEPEQRDGQEGGQAALDNGHADVGQGVVHAGRTRRGRGVDVGVGHVGREVH